MGMLEIMLAGKKGKKKDDEEDTESGDAKTDAGQALLDAIADKDPEAVYDAFELLKEACSEE